MKLTEINTLVLAGCAIRGFAHIGALQYLQDQNVLGSVKKYVGVSIGAIIGYLICIGYSPIEIMVALTTQTDFLNKLSQFDILNVLNGGGASSFSIVQDVLEKLTIQKLGKFITMQELYDTGGKTLVCCTYNRTKECVEYISHTNEPSIPCLVALRMSANLPFLFEPFTYNSCVYLDGGVLDNLPITCLATNDRALALRIKSERCSTKWFSFFDTLMEIISIPVQHIEKMKMQQMQQQCTVITMYVDGPVFFQFTMNTVEKFNLFSVGYDTLRQHYQPAAPSATALITEQVK